MRAANHCGVWRPVDSVGKREVSETHRDQPNPTSPHATGNSAISRASLARPRGLETAPEDFTRRRYRTSNRRAADHAPGVPAAAFARTRNQCRATGSVAVEYADAVTVWLTVGDEKSLWSSIWIV